MLSGLFGRPYSGDDYIGIGRRVLTQERKFNKAAGFTDADDRLPDFFKEEQLAPHNVTWDVPDKELDEVYNFVE